MEDLKILIKSEPTDYKFYSESMEEFKIKVHMILILGNESNDIELYNNRELDYMKYTELKMYILNEKKLKHIELPLYLEKKLLEYLNSEQQLLDFFNKNGLKFDCRYFISFINNTPIIPFTDNNFLMNYDLLKISNEEDVKVGSTIFMAKKFNNNGLSQIINNEIKIQKNSGHYAVHIGSNLYISRIGTSGLFIIHIDELKKLYNNADILYEIKSKSDCDMSFDDIIPTFKDGKIQLPTKLINALN